MEEKSAGQHRFGRGVSERTSTRVQGNRTGGPTTDTSSVALPDFASCANLTALTKPPRAGEARRPRTFDGRIPGCDLVFRGSERCLGRVDRGCAARGSRASFACDCSGEQLKEPYRRARSATVDRRSSATDRLPAMPIGSRNCERRLAHCDSPALILCIGPYVRYEELERYSGLVDLVLSEATAAEVLPRHVSRLLEGRSGRPGRGEGNPLISRDRGKLEQRAARDDCRGLYGAPDIAWNRPTSRWSARALHSSTKRMNRAKRSSRSGMSLCSKSGTDRLERHALEIGPVVALIGFPDRNTVALAKAKGAIACLELPLNLDDLIDVIERFAQSGKLEPRAAPARAEPPHTLPPRPRRQATQRRSHAEAKQWPGPARTPRIVSEANRRTDDRQLTHPTEDMPKAQAEIDRRLEGPGAKGSDQGDPARAGIRRGPGGSQERPQRNG